MIERVTEQGRVAIALAVGIARHFGHDLYPEHLLLGLIREREKTSAPSYVFYFSPLLQIETVKTQLKRALEVLPQALVAGEVQFTHQARHVLNLAIQSAHDVGDEGIGIRHLLFGLLKEEQASAARILKTVSRLETLPRVTNALDYLGAVLGEVSQRD